MTDARLHPSASQEEQGCSGTTHCAGGPFLHGNIKNCNAAVKACLQLAGKGGREGGVAGAVLGGGGPAAGLLPARRRLLRRAGRPVLRPPQLVQGPASFVCGVLPLLLGGWPPLFVLLPYAKSLLGGWWQLLFARPGAFLKALQHLRVNLGQRNLVSGNTYDSCFDCRDQAAQQMPKRGCCDRTEP